uniref:Uncharacterized protein n=1 Tax=Octopus bimaculoides TaxID=37653 RepID=A0A0L8I174_OCTBM
MAFHSFGVGEINTRKVLKLMQSDRPPTLKFHSLGLLQKKEKKNIRSHCVTLFLSLGSNCYFLFAYEKWLIFHSNFAFVTFYSNSKEFLSTHGYLL